MVINGQNKPVFAPTNHAGRSVDSTLKGIVIDTLRLINCQSVSQSLKLCLFFTLNIKTGVIIIIIITADHGAELVNMSSDLLTN